MIFRELCCICVNFALLVLVAGFSPRSKALATQSSAPCHFPAIFNFGDSNSDTGGWSAAFGPIGPPHGETFFHAPAGRYSDGRLLIDFIAESFGLPYLHAFLDSMESKFSHGANFATAASTIRHQNTTYFSPFSLNVQFNQFHGFQQRSLMLSSKEDGFKNLLPSAEDFSQALHTFDIGQNDLAAAYYSSVSSDQVLAAIPDILDHLKTTIKNVYGNGARYFWIHNTGPLGCLAYMLDGLKVHASRLDQAGCSIQLNKAAQHFNSELKKEVAQLREDLPLAAITYVDVYAIKYDLINQSNQYGFEHPLVACCGNGGLYNYDKHAGCGAKATVNGTEVLIGAPCKDPSIRINWDGAHYTEAANKWVFDRFVDGLYSDPPVPLNMACYRK